jgi:hypothetical protein
VTRSDPGIPQLQKHATPKRTKSQRVAWIVIGSSVLALALAVTLPFWLPGVARRFIPDRYLVAYAPEGLKEIIFDSGPSKTLPTPIPQQGNPAADLLSETSSPFAVSPTPPPTVPEATASGEASVQPSPIPFGPTPTLTPAFVPESTEEVEEEQATPLASHLLTDFVYTGQGWNKCGPATLTMLLSYWGVNVTQNDISNVIKPHPEDSNVTPHELAAYVESLGYGATVRINGTLDVLKALIAAGYPVMIERGFDELPEEGWMGHYMLIIGFSEEDQELLALDSYWGRNRVHENQEFPVEHWPYDSLDRVWRHFNRTYLVVYEPDQAAEVATIIGEDMDDGAMYVNALRRIQDELRLNADDVFGWFNLGSVLTELGDYESAAASYDQARSVGLPFRMLWYQFGIYESYFQMERYEDVMTLANTILAIDNYPESEEAYYYRGRVYEARGQIRSARREYKQALHYNPDYEPAQLALAALEDEG